MILGKEIISKSLLFSSGIKFSPGNESAESSILKILELFFLNLLVFPHLCTIRTQSADLSLIETFVTAPIP